MTFFAIIERGVAHAARARHFLANSPPPRWRDANSDSTDS
jgi:hypothetical protein